MPFSQTQEGSFSAVSKPMFRSKHVCHKQEPLTLRLHAQPSSARSTVNISALERKPEEPAGMLKDRESRFWIVLSPLLSPSGSNEELWDFSTSSSSCTSVTSHPAEARNLLNLRSTTNPSGTQSVTKQLAVRRRIKIEFEFSPKLRGARSRLYRRRFLQVNARWKALDEIYKIYIYASYILLHRSDLKISAKNRQHFFRE